MAKLDECENGRPTDCIITLALLKDATTRLTAAVDKLDARVDELSDWRYKVVGASGIVAFIVGGITSIAIAVVAAIFRK